MALKLLESYKKRVSIIYDDIKLVLLSNLDALARDGRMSLKDLTEARLINDKNGLFDPIELYKTLLSLDQSFKESITKPEELGLDSKQALLSLIEDRGDAVTSLYLAIKELKLENSDEFCYTLSSLIERSAKPQELGKEI